MKLTGEVNGRALWELMELGSNPRELEYFHRLSEALKRYGTVWFTDIITEHSAKKAQVVWQISLMPAGNYDIAVFHQPKDTKPETDRIKAFKI